MERDNHWPQFSTLHNQLPSQYMPLTPSPSRFSTSLVSPGARRSPTFTARETGVTRNTCVASARSSRFYSTEECVYKFREWRSGRGGLSPPKNNEKPLIMKVSINNFKDFKIFLGAGDENESAKFPVYTYNKATSTLTIQASASPIHEKAVTLISTGFILARDVLPDDVQSKIDIVTGEKFDNFQGKYKGSEKVADLAVQVQNNLKKGVCDPKFILEVGLSESYEKLCDDAQLWLTGTKTIDIVMVIKLNEEPSYHTPIKDLSDDEYHQLQFPPQDSIDEELFLVDEDYGPATYKEFIWVGRITGFLEIWGHDAVSGLVKPLGNPSRIDLFSVDKINEHVNKYLSMHNFVSGNHNLIRFNWKTYLKNLKRFIGQLAASRCRTTLIDRNGRTNASDYDFLPPSPTSSFSSALSTSPVSSP